MFRHKILSQVVILGLFLILNPVTASQTPQKPKKAFAFSEVSIPPHPRLFYTPAKLKQLRSRIETNPKFQEAWQKIQDQADKLLSDPLVSKEYAEGGSGQHGNYGRPSRQISTMAMYLGLAFQITKETKYAAKLREGGSVAANEVFITIVKTRPMLIHTELPEKHLHQIRPGLRGKVQPTALPDLRLDATVASVSPLPISAGNLEATLRVNLPGEAEALVPGMSCSVKFIPYLNRRALTVPASAVSTDELDDQKHHVCLVTDDGEQKKRQVTVGKKTEDRVEILVGLEEGDEVVKEFPKDKK